MAQPSKALKTRILVEVCEMVNKSDNFSNIVNFYLISHIKAITRLSAIITVIGISEH